MAMALIDGSMSDDARRELVSGGWTPAFAEDGLELTTADRMSEHASAVFECGGVAGGFPWHEVQLTVPLVHAGAAAVPPLKLPWQ